MFSSPQLENSYSKVISVIESCNTLTQLEGAEKMVKNFKILYGKVGYPKTLSYNLGRKLEKQLWELQV
jgi:hypothetical protein|tara:strand:- start:236 stop:439 length:204 start_codon:yes stop_codon:yes gene_type:complete